MPHLIFEYSANLEHRIDIDELCRRALQAACSTGVLELSATRVRAVRCEHFAIADQAKENAFIDGSLRIGKGRSEDDKRAVGKAIYDELRRYCAPLYQGNSFALSLELREIDSDLSWKENSIKQRMKSG